MMIAEGRDAARGSAAARASAFRRRWTWRTRLQVTALGILTGIVLRLLATVADVERSLGAPA